MHDEGKSRETLLDLGGHVQVEALMAAELIGPVAGAYGHRQAVAACLAHEDLGLGRIGEVGVLLVHLHVLFDSSELAQLGFHRDTAGVGSLDHLPSDADVLLQGLVGGVDHDRGVEAALHTVERGGQITEHHSHQSGRDVDIGLFYKKKPAGYPENFVSATADNLDCAATWKLVSAFAARADRDGGTQVMFLDFRVQGLLYKWAKAHGVSEERLERIFQFPHGRGASDGLVRHEPNHDNHLHVRFKCSARDTSCG